MIFQDQLIALLKNAGEEYGYRMYEVDHTGLLLYSRRCYETDPLGSPGYECSRDSKRSLDNNNVHGVEPDLNYGFYNFETEDEEIIDVYIDQGKQVVIFIQVNQSLNYTKIYINPFTVNNRRSQFINILPEYLQIGQIDGFKAYRTVKSADGSIYMINESPAHEIKKISVSITWTGGLFIGAYSGSITEETIATYPSQILDIGYDSIRNSVICLTSSSILAFNDTWSETVIPSTDYTKEYRSITHDYQNDLYFIGNMSGVGSQYNFQGPTRSLMDLDNILNEASIFTIFEPSTGTVTDVPYITLENQESYRYPLIVPIDIPANTPILPCKTYCNIGRIRYYNMNGISKIVCSDDFVYHVTTQSQNTYIYRSILSYSSYTSYSDSGTEIIEGVLTTLATTDDLNAIENVESDMAKWVSFDYGNLIDEECNKVVISDVKICHMRSNRCTGSDNYVRNGDFVYGLLDWYDSNDEEFSDPYDDNLYDRDYAYIKMHNTGPIKQYISISGRVSLQLAFSASDYINPASALVYKLIEATGTVVYTEEILLKDIESPHIYNIDLAVEADALIVELNDAAIVENGSLNLDYVLICDISDQKVCQPGYSLISYDSFIDDSGWEVLVDHNFPCNGEIQDSIINDVPNTAPGAPSEPVEDPVSPEPTTPILSLPSIPIQSIPNGHNFYIVERVVDDKSSKNPSNATVVNKISSFKINITPSQIVIQEKEFGIETEWLINNQSNFNQIPNVPLPIDGPYEFVYSVIDLIDTNNQLIGFVNSNLYRWQNQRPRWLSSYIETPIEIASNALTAVDYGNLSFYVGTMAGEGQLSCPGNYNCNSNLFLSSSWIGQLYRITYEDNLFNTTPTLTKLNTDYTVPVAIKYQEYDNSVSIVSTIKQISSSPTDSEYQYYKRFGANMNQLSVDITNYPTATCVDEINVGNGKYLALIGTKSGSIIAIMHDTSTVEQFEEINITNESIYEINVIVDNGKLYVVTSTRTDPIRYEFGLDRANLLRVSDEDRGPQDYNCIYKNSKCTPTDYSKALQRLSFGYSNVYITDLNSKLSYLLHSSNNTIVKMKKDIYSRFV